MMVGFVVKIIIRMRSLFFDLLLGKTKISRALLGMVREIYSIIC
jgi:hypothetical protein